MRTRTLLLTLLLTASAAATLPAASAGCAAAWSATAVAARCTAECGNVYASCPAPVPSPFGGGQQCWATSPPVAAGCVEAIDVAPDAAFALRCSLSGLTSQCDVVVLAAGWAVSLQA